MSDSQWPPKPASILRALVGTAVAVSMSVGAWLGMDWIEGRMLLAQTVVDVGRVRADLATAEQSVSELEEHDHKVDLAIQRLTDMIAIHDEKIDDLDNGRRRR